MIRKIKILGLFLLFYWTANAQRINELLDLAVAHNPKLQAVRLRYQAAQKVAGQVGELPNPQVGLGLPVLRTETRLGAPVVTVSVSQMFPWKGTLKAKEEVAIAMSKTKYDDIEATRLELEYRIKSAYYRLFLLDRQQALLRENWKLNQSLEQVALGRVESGKAAASDVLRIQIKAKKLEKQIEILDVQKQQFQAQLVEAVGDDVLTDNRVQIISSELEVLPDLSQELLAETMASIRGNYPLLKKLDAKMRASQAVRQLNELKGKPSFGVGLNYSLVQKRSDANPLHNGRDILIPTFRASIPIFRKQYKAKQQEEALKQKSLEADRQALELKINTSLTNYWVAFQQARLEMELADEQSQLSQSAFDMLLSWYSAKGTRFDELLKLKDDLFEYKLKKETALVNLFLAQAGIERFGIIQN